MELKTQVLHSWGNMALFSLSLNLLSVLFQLSIFFSAFDLRTSAYMTGFYADDAFRPGGGQTVLLNRIPGEHRRALKREILSLLGLHHRPRPSSHGKFNSAPNYMLDLYNTLSVDRDGEEEEREKGLPPVVKQRLVNHNLTLPGMEESAGGADMIASFVNRGKLRSKRTPDYPQSNPKVIEE